jgi:hypothetical protein
MKEKLIDNINNIFKREKKFVDKEALEHEKKKAKEAQEYRLKQ